MPALAKEISRHPLRRLYLSFFGTAAPLSFGLRYTTIPGFCLGERRADAGLDPDGKEWIALSTTNLLGVFEGDPEAYAWLRERPMTALIANSIALYDITGDEEAHRRLGESALHRRDFQAAREPLRRALELAPSDAAARASLAKAEAQETP